MEKLKVNGRSLNFLGENIFTGVENWTCIECFALLERVYICVCVCVCACDVRRIDATGECI